MRVPSVSVPTLDLDLYEDSVLRDSREAFARIRDAGPVVWLPRHRMYAIGRFDDVRAVLRDDETFVSGKGVVANRLTNLLARGTTLFSDGDTHVARRIVLKRSLGAKALTAIEDRIDNQARALIDRLVAEREFETARDFASHLPLSAAARLLQILEAGVSPGRELRRAFVPDCSLLRASGPTGDFRSSRCATQVSRRTRSRSLRSAPASACS